MKMFSSLFLLLAAGAALAGCQSDEERTKAARDRMLASCQQRAQSATTMPGVDPDRFCNCLADRLLAQGVDGPPPDTALIGEQCQVEATRAG